MDAQIPDGHQCHRQWQEIPHLGSWSTLTWKRNHSAGLRGRTSTVLPNTKSPCGRVYREYRGLCGSIAIASLCGKVYRQSIEGPMWQQHRPDITRAPVQLSREGVVRDRKVMQCVAQVQLTNDITQRPVKAHSSKKGWEDNVS